MASGPPLIGDNRFALLADRSPQSKRKKRNRRELLVDFPSLPSQKTSNPKYIVVAAVNEKKPLSDYSCFAIHRSLNLISKEIISITQLRDGNLLLLVKNELTAQKFLSTRELAGLCSITCRLHEHLNYTKGTIFAPYLTKIPEKEIIEELKSQGVVDVYKYTRVTEGNKSFSGAILLTFDLYHTPETIDVSWYKVKVREYIPNPMRCKNCQLLGHTLKRCKNMPACVNCNLPPHTPNVCTRTYCANCAEDHPASSNKCKKFLQEKEILKIKTKRKCSMREAIIIHKEQTQTTNSPSSFSAITANRNPPTTNPTIQNTKNNTTEPLLTQQSNQYKNLPKIDLTKSTSSIITSNLKNNNSETLSITNKNLSHSDIKSIPSTSKPLSSTISNIASKVTLNNSNSEPKQTTLNASTFSNSLISKKNPSFSPIELCNLSESSSNSDATVKDIEFMTTEDELSDC